MNKIDPDKRYSPVIMLSLVVPVYNEAEMVGIFFDQVTKIFEGIFSINLEIIFVNDGSTDETLNALLLLQKKHSFIRIIDLSRNFGKEAALTAGLKLARGQIITIIDVDLQDPPELILMMIEKWREGYDVILGRRNDRSKDSWLKRVTATWFYRIFNWIGEYKIPPNVGDFRLMDRSVVNVLNELPESRRFMKGLFSWVGFRTVYIDYSRSCRKKGSSKFNARLLCNLALEGITSFSTYPLRVWTYLGIVTTFISCLFTLKILLNAVIYGFDTLNYSLLFTLIFFLNGLQMIAMGVIGEYLGRTYIESKRRPAYIIRRIYEHKENLVKLDKFSYEVDDKIEVV